jgi:predicted AAA+ superfamily ATPase
MSGLARDAKLKTITATRYIGLMEAAFLVLRLPPYLGNKASRLVKSPKLFFSDSGLACFLAGIERLAPNSEEPLRGAMLETYVAQNLLSILQSHWPQARLHFWNVQGRHEVDFVIESGRETVAIEVKASTRWSEQDLSGLKHFLEKTPGCRAAILGTNHFRAVQLADRLYAIPLRKLLS